MFHVLSIVFFASSLVFAHGGRLDSQGGHNDNAAGNYHFHDGPLDGQVFASKEEAISALQPVSETPDLLTSSLPVVPVDQVRIASFNIRIYSNGSRDDSELALIADRLQQFDLIAVQELRDEDVVQRTLSILGSRGNSYEAMVSAPVGRGVSERYAFLWRPGRVTSLEMGAVVPDPDDAFIREPFYASFRAGAFDFTLVTIHSIFGDRIGDRRAEAMLLDEVYQTIQDQDPNEQDVILLGDFNLPPEDSGFLRLRELLTPLFTGNRYTTISEGAESLYDNIWFDHEHVGEYTGVNGIDAFDVSVFGNDDDAASLAVSDHRPIWANFSTNADDDGSSAPTPIDQSPWGHVKTHPSRMGAGF